MTTVAAKRAGANLDKLLEQAKETHEPVHIEGRRSHGMLVSEDDWRAIQETLFLVSIPGMRESVRKGLRTPIERCSSRPGW